jgi:hypothetical protein
MENLENLLDRPTRLFFAAAVADYQHGIQRRSNQLQLGAPRLRLQDGQVNEGCGVRGRLEE